MKKLFLSLSIILSSTLGYSYFEPGTQWDINKDAYNLQAKNAPGGCWNPSLGSGGGIDFSTWMQPQLISDITSGGTGNVILSPSAAASWKGNCVTLLTGTNFNLSSAWWQVQAVTPGVSFTVVPSSAASATVNASTGIVAVAGTMYLGGAMPGTDFTPTPLYPQNISTIFESMTASSTLWIKASSEPYNINSAVSSSQRYPTVSTPSFIVGYQNVHGDLDNLPNNSFLFGMSTMCPIISMGANTFTAALNTEYRNLEFIGTANPIISLASAFANYTKWTRCKFFNNSATINRSILSTTASASIANFRNCEFTCQFGFAATLGLGVLIENSYLHHCTTAILNNGSGNVSFIKGNVFASNLKAPYYDSVSGSLGHKTWIDHNSFIGFENLPQVSTFVIIQSSALVDTSNNIFYKGWSAVENRGFAQGFNQNLGNAYYNMVSTFSGASDQMYFDTYTAWAINPQFTNVTELFGSTASISATVLKMDGGGMFDNSGITDGTDYLTCHWGTGATQGHYLIVGHSSFSVTLNATIGTDTTQDKVFTIRTGKQFDIGTNLKGLDSYTFSGTSTTYYNDLGAVQRQEQTTSGGSTGFFIQ